MPTAAGSVPCQTAGGSIGQSVSDEPWQLGERNVENHRIDVAQLGQRQNTPSGLDHAAERLEFGDERVADALRAADRDRPTLTMRQSSQHQTGRGVTG